jgi:competence ComEA-like helix-hairpin-helix protein
MNGAEAAPARAPRARQRAAADTAAAQGEAQPDTRAPATEAAGTEAGQEGAGGRTRGGTRDGKLNLNTATRAELTRLPRIGEQTADRIIQFREQQGPIRNLRQLRQADILPLSAYRQIRELVRV